LNYWKTIKYKLGAIPILRNQFFFLEQRLITGNYEGMGGRGRSEIFVLRNIEIMNNTMTGLVFKKRISVVPAGEKKNKEKKTFF